MTRHISHSLRHGFIIDFIGWENVGSLAAMTTNHFWATKKLSELNEDEWEALCDGCGRCCVWKFEDDDTREIIYTDIRCELFDEGRCRCNDYRNRARIVPDCLSIRSLSDHQYSWLPPTCAYRLRHEGKPLFDWHPLISGNDESVHTAGISLRGKTVCGDNFSEEDIIRHIIDPDKPDV